MKHDLFYAVAPVNGGTTLRLHRCETLVDGESTKKEPFHLFKVELFHPELGSQHHEPIFVLAANENKALTQAMSADMWWNFGGSDRFMIQKYSKVTKVPMMIQGMGSLNF